jgi:hypothetical protein
MTLAVVHKVHRWKYLRNQAVKLKTSFTGTGAARLIAGTSYKTVLFRYREATDFDCDWVERTSAGRESPAPFTVHYYAN